MPDDINKSDLVTGLVDQTLGRPEAEREVHLRNVCADDTELFAQAWRQVKLEEQIRNSPPEPMPATPLAELHLVPKQILSNRFTIVREVAQGGMGIVYEAWDQKLDKRVALKCAKPGFRQRLSPEVRHAQEITHPNVCKIFEIHTIALAGREIDFITMEFLDGPTLAERLQAGRPPDQEAR